MTAEPSTQLSRALAGRYDISREIGRGGIRICCRCSIRVKRTVSSSTVMPFVEGESLRARLDREKQLPVDEAVRIASAVAAALDYADSNGVIRGSAFATRSWTSSAEFNAPGRGECAPGYVGASRTGAGPLGPRHNESLQLTKRPEPVYSIHGSASAASQLNSGG